jgi:hypothetical protein
MTDRELMQESLLALRSCSGAPHWPSLQPIVTALRERLARLDFEMQPCAGRNCGSTNPNLHSAECFEDYDKATGADSNRTWTQAHWTEYEHSIVAAEREAIAQSLDKQADLAADEIDRQWAQEMAAAVRARGKA